jgi:hypothetical protein
VQAAMLVTTKKFPFRGDAFTPGQMHAALNTPHHILALQGGWLIMRFVLPLFKRLPITSYYPEKKNDNKSEEKNSTHGIVLVAALEFAAVMVKDEILHSTGCVEPCKQ